jgi:protein associated with RNAse G/E
MKTYKTDGACEQLFNRFAVLKIRAKMLPEQIHNASAIVQNANTVVTEEDLKAFFTQVASIQNKLEMMVSELDDLYGDVGVYIDEREVV